MSPYKLLLAAQEFVDRYDDGDWFAERYSEYRQFYSVKESVELALHSMDLWSDFAIYADLADQSVDQVLTEI